MAIADDELRSRRPAHLSFVRSQQGRAQDALDLLEESRVVFREHGLEWEEAADWVLTAWAEIARGDYGASSAIHTTRLLSMSEDLPVAVIIVDSPEQIPSCRSWTSWSQGAS